MSIQGFVMMLWYSITREDESDEQHNGGGGQVAGEKEL